MAKLAIITEPGATIRKSKTVRAYVGSSMYSHPVDADIADEANHRIAAFTLAEKILTRPNHIVSAQLGAGADSWAHVFVY